MQVSSDIQSEQQILTQQEQNFSKTQFIKQRLLQQLTIIRHRTYFIILYVFIDYWVAGVVFRNLAFYRFQVGDRLKDLGFNLIPQHITRFTNLPLYILLGILVITSFLTFVPRPGQFPYLANIAFRIFSINTIGHILRSITFIGTSLPGSAFYCLKSNSQIQNARPHTLYQIFFLFKFDSGSIELGQYNCGDLTFSGHMIAVITTALAIYRYLPQHINMKPISKLILAGLLVIAIIIQSILIIMARHHYTMDIIIALYVIPLIWHSYSILVPNQYNPIIPAKKDNQESKKAINN